MNERAKKKKMTTCVWSKLMCACVCACELVLSELAGLFTRCLCVLRWKKERRKEMQREKEGERKNNTWVIVVTRHSTTTTITNTITNLTSSKAKRKRKKESTNEIFHHHHLSIQNNIWRALANKENRWRIIYSFRRESVLNQYIWIQFPPMAQCVYRTFVCA